MGPSSNRRVALLWLVSAFGAVAIARHEAQLHPPALPGLAGARTHTLRPGPREQVPKDGAEQAEALRDGRRIDINRASAVELELLPGVGPSLAKRLVEARARFGRFSGPTDLRRVKGVGEKTLAKLAPFLSFESE
jgi:competence ComEA-like helix-hairpin-helix protein